MIASHRGKLMKLAAIESGSRVANGQQSQSNTTNTHAGTPLLSSDTDVEMARQSRKHNKSKCKSKGSKRKRGRRKAAPPVLSSLSSDSSTTNSEVEDAMQPSTSAGLSRRHLYAESSSENDSSATEAKKRRIEDGVLRNGTDGAAAVTPAKVAPPTSDSGITSEVSTVEKASPEGAKSQDREGARKRLHLKKVEAAVKYKWVEPDSSDSSD